FVKGAKLLPMIRLVSNEGVVILTANNLPSVCLEPDSWYDRPIPEGLFRSTCKMPGNLLKEGYYFVNVVIGNLAGAIDRRVHVRGDQILSFEIIDKDPLTLRCLYCERETHPSFIASSKWHQGTSDEKCFHKADRFRLEKIKPGNLLMFDTEEDALARGFKPDKNILKGNL
ncbi:MAG: hypothetical protein NTV30_01000, partial [Chloroflexi bacterium]|nr:hypothetical protein [Chloroflexota bacterium]